MCSENFLQAITQKNQEHIFLLLKVTDFTEWKTSAGTGVKVAILVGHKIM